MKEVLLNNLLDKEFQRMLFPLNLMQTILLQPKYRILKGFVTPIGIREYFLCFLGVIVVTFTNLMKWHTSKYFYKDLTSVDTLLVFDTVFYSVSSFFLMSVNFAQSKNNALLIQKLQQIYKLFNSNSGLKKSRNNNWMAIFITIFSCILFLIINYGRRFHEILFVISLYYFDGNIIFAIQIIKFLEHETKMWLNALDRFCGTCSEPNHNKLTEYFSEIEQQETRLFAAFLDIMEAFKLYKAIFQFSILFLAIENFVHPLTYIQNFLSSGAENDADIAVNLFYGLVTSLWVVKNFTLLIVLSVACQKFYLVVQEVEKATAVISSYHASLFILNIQKLCKNVGRVTACARAGGELRAGGVVAVDAGLPLRLLALLATYTVVLLQFAFL